MPFNQVEQPVNMDSTKLPVFVHPSSVIEENVTLGFGVILALKAGG